MQVILLENVRNLGKIGDAVRVKPGYGRNFLLPSGKAVKATKANLAEFEAKRAELEKHAAEVKAEAEARSKKLSDITLDISAKASDEGKLYGSIAVREIVEAFDQAGHEVDKREVELPEGPIRVLGQYPIHLQLHPDVTVEVTINVVADEKA